MKFLPLFLLLCLSACSQGDWRILKKNKVVELRHPDYHENAFGGMAGVVVSYNSTGVEIFLGNGTAHIVPWTSVRSLRVLDREEEAKWRAVNNFPKENF